MSPSQMHAHYPARGWARKIEGLAPIFSDYDPDRPQDWPGIRDRCVVVLKEDPIYKLSERGHGRGERFERFTDAVTMMEDAVSPDDFDEAIDALYDWADDFRVWIEPIA